VIASRRTLAALRLAITRSVASFSDAELQQFMYHLNSNVRSKKEQEGGGRRKEEERKGGGGEGEGEGEEEKILTLVRYVDSEPLPLTIPNNVSVLAQLPINAIRTTGMCTNGFACSLCGVCMAWRLHGVCVGLCGLG
jgi:hypothetical protein